MKSGFLDISMIAVSCVVLLSSCTKKEIRSAEPPTVKAGDEKVVEVAPGVKVTFCWCPEGSFVMGSPESEEHRGSDENQVNVTLSKGFWMAKTEVTQDQWQAVMGGNPSEFKGTNRPVEQVSWYDAQKFLAEINARVGKAAGWKMSLPTEAQWEYAARAGEIGIYAGGALDEVAWYGVDMSKGTCPVGAKKPNAFGLHDMSGNVFEWCLDWYDKELVGGSDPIGSDSGSARVFRGGGWFGPPHSCRIANRHFDDPAFADSSLIGFRVVLSSVP